MAADGGDLDLLRRRVLNVVGHELRTPVAVLAGLATELATCTDERRRAELTAAVVRSALRLDHLLGDLLIAAGITTAVPVGVPEPIDLVAAARARGAVCSGSAMALARPATVERALTELLDNAAVHGLPPVTLTGSTADGRAVVEVASGGPTPPAEDLALAGELFYRGEAAVTTRAGLGIGLALVRTLARADGGDVSLRPGVGGGVIARLELPAP